MLYIISFFKRLDKDFYFYPLPTNISNNKKNNSLKYYFTLFSSFITQTWLFLSSLSSSCLDEDFYFLNIQNQGISYGLLYLILFPIAIYITSQNLFCPTHHLESLKKFFLRFIDDFFFIITTDDTSKFKEILGTISK